MIMNAGGIGGGTIRANLIVNTLPIKTTYTEGESIDLTGCVVTWSGNGFSVDVTNLCTFSPTSGSEAHKDMTEIVVTYITGGVTYTTSIPIVVTNAIKNNAIYGVEGNLLTTATLTRTDDAADFGNPTPYIANATTYGSPFDNIMPWSGMERVTDSNAGELVKIPKFWFKLGDLGSTGANFKLQIANYAADGFSVAPAFMDRGDGKGERDYVYVGRYHCSEADYKSTSGVMPKNNIWINDARTYIHALGSNVWHWDYAMLTTIRMLYLVEYASFGNAKFGYGGSQSSGLVNEGGSDSMPYHTGTVGASISTTPACNQYRYIEGLNYNISVRVDGIFFGTDYDPLSIYIIKNPADFSNRSKGSLVGTQSSETGYIKNFQQGSNEFNWFFYPFNSKTRQELPPFLGYISYSRSWDLMNFPVDNSIFSYRQDISTYGGNGARLMVLP